ASALKSLDPKLDPFVIQVSSEPEWFPDRCVSPKEARGGAMRPTLPEEADFKLLGTLGNITTVNATRIARGYQTIQELPERMHALNGKDSHELIFVCPQERENIIAKFFRGEVMTRAASEQPAAQAWKNVSLSWWLSPPLQAYLDAQLHSPRNQRTMDRILGLLEERGQENRPATSQQKKPAANPAVATTVSPCALAAADGPRPNSSSPVTPDASGTITAARPPIAT